VEFIKKRDELEKRKAKDGFFRIVRNCFLTISSKIHNIRAKRKLKQYKQKKHLEKVLKRYQDTVERMIEPNRNWYIIDVPQLDIHIVERELLSIQEASERFRISETVIKGLIERGNLSSYFSKSQEIIRKSELRKVLPT